ncbi:MAG: hypothetical protein PHU62_05175 [Bacteroidales bacterium]|jgi:hypothetical protein|nr:hypothetical protein [Bacteroidales bacterium]MDD2204627.1 hypothetical protein [Bacteroidales bacterium]MDD3152195.1 hypothetical protein [Bacteroidales bacterium]MDD3913698.1 hypothetical protein [Bacteroidales bacterium]MDD4633949.1 hypothetical protein [Bacteroidales bacterium]
MKTKTIVFLILSVLSAILVSCNVGEGEGGTGSVEGYVKLVLHPDDNYSLNADTVAASKTDVFIKYGDNDYFDDDIETDETGFYRFKYLRPGEYTVFAYSKLPDDNKVAVSETINITRGEEGIVGDIYIHDGKSYNTSLIKGYVYATYYDKGDVVGIGWAYEQRVYIKRQGEDFYFDDVRVSSDGVFIFQKLEVGIYEIYTISYDPDTEVPSIVSKTIEVTEPEQIYEIEEIFYINIIV